MDQKSSDGINNFITVRTTAFLEDLKQTPSSMSGAGVVGVQLTDFPTSHLTLAQILWIQRLVSTGQDVVRYGIRDVDVWLGGDSPKTAVFTPMPPTEIISNLDLLIKNWVVQYDVLRAQNRDSIVSSIAAFHYDFLKIHPLLDANGRVARALLRQQMIELLDADIPNIFTDKPVEYYESLEAANNGNVDPLIKLLKDYLD